MNSHFKGKLICKDKVLEFNGRNAKIMGILNVTPDSFSDGGVNCDKENAIRHAVEMAEYGADIIDIGGESTRPGYVPVSVEEELERVCSVVELVHRETDVLISVDTSKPNVADAALRCGAHIINDVTGFASEDMCTVQKKYNSGAIAMFNNRTYSDDKRAIEDRAADFFMTVSSKIKSGLIIDPGIGFGTDSEEDLKLVRNIERFKNMNSVPLLLALSRKRMIASYMGRPSDAAERDSATVGANLAGIGLGADIIRVHDVKGAADSLRLWETIMDF
ncbi:MAG: dihydropteroate synthase [Clostridia bacterium]|nr:dihydropteroate synthase [Clostridia bacterium]